jgi:hypothetical protein
MYPRLLKFYWFLLQESDFAYLEQLSDSPERTEKNIARFSERINALRQGVLVVPDMRNQVQQTASVMSPDVYEPADQFMVGGPADERGRWFTPIDKFISFLANSRQLMLDELEPITVALIDDGINIYHRELQDRVSLDKISRGLQRPRH